jgi:hypothetical protein
VIYFVAACGTSLVKIGYCSGNPERRITSLKTGCPHPLKLLGRFEGSRDDERAWHRRFAHLRVHGEWFLWKPELRKAAKPYLFYTEQLRRERARRKFLREIADCERMLSEKKAA